MKSFLGIEDDYYVSLSPDAPAGHIEPLLNQIRSITRAKPR